MSEANNSDQPKLYNRGNEVTAKRALKPESSKRHLLRWAAIGVGAIVAAGVVYEAGSIVAGHKADSRVSAATARQVKADQAGTERQVAIARAQQANADRIGIDRQAVATILSQSQHNIKLLSLANHLTVLEAGTVIRSTPDSLDSSYGGAVKGNVVETVPAGAEFQVSGATEMVLNGNTYEGFYLNEAAMPNVKTGGTAPAVEIAQDMSFVAIDTALANKTAVEAPLADSVAPLTGTVTASGAFETQHGSEVAIANTFAAGTFANEHSLLAVN